MTKCSEEDHTNGCTVRCNPEYQKLEQENIVLLAAVKSMILALRTSGLKNSAQTLLDTCTQNGVSLDV